MILRIDFNDVDLKLIKESIEYVLNDNMGNMEEEEIKNLIDIKNTIKKVLDK